MPTPNVIDGVIENEFALIQSVLDHRERLDDEKNGVTNTEKMINAFKEHMLKLCSSPWGPYLDDIYRMREYEASNNSIYTRNTMRIPTMGTNIWTYIQEDNRSENS